MKKDLTRPFDWDLCCSTDFDAVSPNNSIAILPTAAIEQHGPHLPVGTDSLIMNGMLDEFRKRCPNDLDPWILPIQQIGKYNEILWAKGSITLTAVTAVMGLKDIEEQVTGAG